MADIVVIGAGWGGSAAAVAAAQKGCRVTLVEKNDRLLGYGLVAGEVYQNARLTICLEARAMGGGSLFDAVERQTRHRGTPVPGAEHTLIYDVMTIESEIRDLLASHGVTIIMETRAVDVKMDGERIASVDLENGTSLKADAFVDCSGTAGPMNLCVKHGWGCSSCLNRCSVFGGRISIAAKAGVREKAAVRPGGKLGIPGHGVNLIKDSLDSGLVSELEREGIVFIPVPPGFSEQRKDLPGAEKEIYQKNIIIVDTGLVKIKSRPFIPLDLLRKVPGFRNAVYFDPAGGSKSNCIRFFAAAPRDNHMLVKGTQNLFVGGEKQCLMVGCSEAMVTGLLAGHNAARLALNEGLLELPRTTASGEMIAFSNERLADEHGYLNRYSCFSGELFENLKKLSLYTSDYMLVKERVKSAGLENVLA